MKILYYIVILLVISTTAMAQIDVDTIYVDNNCGFEDTKIYYGSDNNYGGNTTLSFVNNPGISQIRYSMFKYDTDSLIGRIGIGTEVDSVAFDFWAEVSVVGTVFIFRLLKPFYEGTQTALPQEGATSYSEWYYSTNSALDSLWGTAGAGNIGYGTDNRLDGSGNDRRQDTLFYKNMVVADTQTYISIVIPGSTIQAQISGSIANNGYFMMTDGTGQFSFSSSEAIEDLVAPHLIRRPMIRVFKTTTPSGGGVVTRRGRIVKSR